MLNREFLEKRREDLKAQLARALDTAKAVDGALQECEYILATFDKTEEQQEDK